MHARATMLLILLLLPINGDSASSAPPGDQVSAILEVAFPIEAGYDLKGLELCLEFFLGHDDLRGMNLLYYMYHRFAGVTLHEREGAEVTKRQETCARPAEQK